MSARRPETASPSTTEPGNWERREGRRVPVYGSRVRSEARSDASEVRLLNLSEQGLAVEGARRLTAGRRYRFTLRDDAGESASFEGEVLWCRRVAGAGGASVYRAGIRRLGGSGESGAG